MMNHPGPARDDAQNVLSATRVLTRRVRLTQRGAWFPLLVFAAVTLGATPFNRYGPHPIHCSSSRGGGHVCIAYSALALWYWPAALLAAYMAISWFYLHRARQRGVGTRVQPYVVVGAVLALLTTAWALWAYAHPAFLAETLRLGSSQPATFLDRIASPAGGIGLALLLLAWIERSWPLLALTAVYLIVTTSTVGIGARFSHPSPWAFLPHLLLDGAVLLVGGIILALVQRAQGRSTA
jgi:hypothetical protein